MIDQGLIQVAAKAGNLLPVREVVLEENLEFMRKLPDGCCDLIYVDPPFETPRPGQRSGGRLRKNSHAPRAVRSFAAYMRLRLEQMQRLLSRKGSLWVHLDWHTVHYIKCMLDEIFGMHSFLNEIIWSYRAGSRPGPWFPRKHDTILVYAKSMGRHTFHPLRGGEYRTQDLRKDPRGVPYKSTRNGRLYFHPDGPAITDVWEIPILSTVSRERVGYPSQKPLALLKRVIESASDPHDLVADFFCGSGTTLVAAKMLNRNWLGCDIEPRAVQIAHRRLAAVKDA